jgi:hypothetical protein
VPVIPATEEVEIRRITVGGQSGQKVSKTPIQQNRLVCANGFTPVILATLEAEIRRIVV